MQKSSPVGSLLNAYICQCHEREEKLVKRVSELEKRNSVLEERLRRASLYQEDFLAKLDELEQTSRTRRLRRTLEHGIFTASMSQT